MDSHSVDFAAMISPERAREVLKAKIFRPSMFFYAQAARVEAAAELSSWAQEFIDPRHIYVDVCSSSTPPHHRGRFIELSHSLSFKRRTGRLVLPSLSVLGATPRAVHEALEAVLELRVKVIVAALGLARVGRRDLELIADLSRSQTVAASDAIRAGLDRARANGASLGRKASLNRDQVAAAAELVASGISAAEVARRFDVSDRTVRRHLERLRDFVED